MKIKFENQDTGEVVNEWEMTASQQRFWDSKKKIVLFSGGFGCGKSLILTLKAIDMCLKYPGNFVLMGRQTYIQLRDSLLKEFLIICPEHLIKKYNKAELKIELINGSEIIFRHLDKVAATEIRSMNLGCAFIDQAEEITKEVFLAIKGRLRRDVVGDGDRKIYMSINPELTWHFAEFKQNPKPEYELIEASTLENEKNLPKEYVQDLLNYPESYKQQYVYGVWDESLLSGNTVFAPEDIERLKIHLMDPPERSTFSEKFQKKIPRFTNLKVYKEFVPGNRYQLGIDVAEGSEEETESKDKSSITVADLTSLEEVAHWTGQVPPDIVAEFAAQIARLYQEKGGGFCTIVPEMNSIGLALVNALKKEDDLYLYRREEFDKSVNKKLKRIGWRTTRQSKPLMVNHFQELLRKRNPRLRTREIHEEFKTFIHSDESRKSGMGAKYGFHDDRIMSLFLAFFEKGEVTGANLLHSSGKSAKMSVKLQPSLIITKGKAHLRGMEPLRSRVKWTTH